MMNPETKRAVMGRMRRIAGQVEAIGRMVEEDRYCVDLMHLLAAVQAALGQVGQVVLKSHVETCVSDALRSGDRRQRQRKIDELMEVFSRYGHIRER
jgi:CsoR family transcriptional regulator, copper-sensing transcriptional repressor